MYVIFLYTQHIWHFRNIIMSEFLLLLIFSLITTKLDCPVIKTLERHFFTLSECLSNVLITGEFNFDERNGQLIRGSFLNK